jgi:hypothetical protein
VPRHATWQGLLLLPQPPLSLAYLLAVRAGWLGASFVPLLFLITLPVASAAAGVVGMRQSRSGAIMTGLVLAAVELAWGVLSLAIAGFQIAWRSGG